MKKEEEKEEQKEDEIKRKMSKNKGLQKKWCKTEIERERKNIKLNKYSNK